MCSFDEELNNFIILHEGKKNLRYFDKYGNRTIGIGFNLEAKNAKNIVENWLNLSYKKVYDGKIKLTDRQIDILYCYSHGQALKDAQQFCPSFNSLHRRRQIVLIDMAYNLGFARLATFKNLQKALANKNWNKAADEIINSKWYKQVGVRGEDNQYVMRHAEMPPRCKKTAKANNLSINYNLAALMQNTIWYKRHELAQPRIIPSNIQRRYNEI
ncbi:MAG: hypothetical protein ACK4PR_03015 [Gammaproteobacteria bacterium]